LAVRFSSFGNLFTVWSNTTLPKLTIESVVSLLESSGFLYVLPECLDEPYTGQNAVFLGQPWRVRFFDYT
jgi:hypothetical protein